MDYLQYNWPAIFYQDPPFWAMPDTYIKYWFLKLLRRKPIWNWDAEEIFDGYVPGEGVYISDGVYVSLSTWAIMQGFTPMWKSDGRGL
jgi:hypothetical protein